MWLFEQSNVELMDIFRSSFLTYLLLILPIFVTLSPGCFGSKEFQAFRLQQFDLHGTSYGSSGSILNYETRILPGSQIVSSPRRCYLVKLVDLTIGMYRDLLKYSVAGVIIIVPSPQEIKGLSNETIEQIHELEDVMLQQGDGTESPTVVPVYFIEQSEEVTEVYETVKESAESLGTSSTGLQTLLQHIHGNGVQIVTGSTIGTPKVKTDAQITSIQGSLLGSQAEKYFPILISAHYDSMSPAAELSFGADSNGSGVTTLLELARIFSHLYSHQGSAGGKSTSSWSGTEKPQSSLLFLLSGAGYFNYHGTQKYLEDQTENIDNSELLDTKLAVCLDSLIGNPNKIYVHVSRQLKEGSMLNTFVQNLIKGTEKLYPEIQVEVVPKKIRTDSLLSWEHEKFILKKINAVTLSSHSSPDFTRSSLLDVKGIEDVNDLAKKVHTIGEAVAASIFNVSGIGTAFSGSLSVSEESISSIFDYVSSEPRSAQLLATKQNKFVQSLRALLGRYTHETTLFVMKPDKRDANLVFYDTTGGVITAYDVKPAVFDLVLSCGIAAYLAIIYFLIMYFHMVYEFFTYVCKDSPATNGTANHSTNSQRERTKETKSQ